MLRWGGEPSDAATGAEPRGRGDPPWSFASSRCPASILLAIAFVPGSRAGAQVVYQDPGQLMSGMQAPRFAPSGDWAEIVTITPKWLVIQNEKGQQFPVALDSVGEFVIRWPIDPARITPNAMVETTGLDLGTNQVRTDHIDVFEREGRMLVQPVYQQIIGFGRTPTTFDIQNQNTYGVRIPLLPGEDQLPNRLHVAGPIVGLDPVRISMGGNNAMTVLPAATGLSFNEVTPGVVALLRPGDLVYVIPTDMTPKTLIVGQMVAYKAVTKQQFVR